MASAEDPMVHFDDAPRDRRMHERRLAFEPVTRVELAPPRARIAWSGVWGGFLIAFGIWITLATLGAAVGLSNVRAGSDLTTTTMSRAATGWMYVAGLIALFFGGVFGTRLAMIVDGAIAWFEATLIWTFALVMLTLVTTMVGSMAAANPAAANAVAQSSAAATNPGTLSAGAWLTFVGIVVAWVVTVLGSFWGRAQARGRARSLGMAA